VTVLGFRFVFTNLFSVHVNLLDLPRMSCLSRLQT